MCVSTTILPQIMTCLFNFSELRIVNYLSFTFTFFILLTQERGVLPQERGRGGEGPGECLQGAEFRRRHGKPNQRMGQNEEFMNFAHFCEFWCFSLGKQARFTLNFCSGMPPGKAHELALLWFGLPGPLLMNIFFRGRNGHQDCCTARCTDSKTDGHGPLEQADLWTHLKVRQ